jgi:hypothetical protein
MALLSVRTTLAGALLGTALVGGGGRADAAPVAVRYVEGVAHGFLALRAPSGETLADGELLQIARPAGVESRMVFRFRDGSVYDETVVFGQQHAFALMSYKLAQRGPTFPEDMDVTVERSREQDRGRYQVRSRRRGGGEETASGDLELPPDVYNGMLIMLVRNLARDTAETVHVLAFTPKPMLVQLEMTPIGDETVPVGERRMAATHYVLKPKLGLLRGTAAAVLGKTPSDYHCWIVTTGAPAFVAIDGPLFNGGPIWRIETVTPRGPGRPVSRR